MEDNLQMLLCMQDDQFKNILQNDQVLNQLDKQKNNKKDEYYQLMSVLSNRFIICGLKVKPITPMLWSFLYCIDNNFVTHKNQITETDIDVFFYLLHYGLSALNDQLFYNSKDFCKQHSIDYQQAESQILQMILLAFRPMQMFPKNGIAKEDVKFNLDWLTRIVSIVCPLTNKDSVYVMTEMSLTQAFSYVVQYSKQYDVNDEIKRRNSDQINAEIYKRTFELGKKYYQDNYKNK